MSRDAEATRVWTAYLDALDQPAALRRVATPDGAAFPEQWLNPDQDGFAGRVAALRKGWRPPLHNVAELGRSTLHATLFVKPWRAAFWMFGPRVSVLFESRDDQLRVAAVGFMGG